jgi:hypothetical protein
MILSITLFVKLIHLSNSSIISYSYSPCNSRVMFFPSFFVPTSLLQSTLHFHALHPSLTPSFFKDIIFNKFLLHHHYTYKYIIQLYYCSLHKKIHKPNKIKIFLFHYTKTIQNTYALCVNSKLQTPSSPSLCFLY